MPMTAEQDDTGGDLVRRGHGSRVLSRAGRRSPGGEQHRTTWPSLDGSGWGRRPPRAASRTPERSRLPVRAKRGYAVHQRPARQDTRRPRRAAERARRSSTPARSWAKAGSGGLLQLGVVEVEQVGGEHHGEVRRAGPGRTARTATPASRKEPPAAYASSTRAASIRNPSAATAVSSPVRLAKWWRGAVWLTPRSAARERRLSAEGPSGRDDRDRTVEDRAAEIAVVVGGHDMNYTVESCQCKDRATWFTVGRERSERLAAEATRWS